jgi:predicted PurR-regulated permease PerM
MEVRVIEHQNLDTEKLNATVVGLGIRLAFLGAVLFLALSIIRPFFETIVWSVVWAVALYPVFDWAATRLGGRRKLAAALITVLLILIVFGPATWLALDLAEILRRIYQGVDSGAIVIPQPVPRVKDLPLIGEQLFQFWELAWSNLTDAFVKIAPYFKPMVGTLIGAAGTIGVAILQFFFSVLIAGFLLSPGPSLVQATAKFLDRRVSRRGEEFMHLAGATIRNVSQGVIGVAVLQALLAGIGLILLGVPGAGLIAFGVLIFGIIQIGPTLIMIPVVIWSWMTKETSTALFFTAYIVPVCLIDNILRPIIFARGLKTPMLVIIAGVIGGTLSNGIIGLFVGPIVLAVAWDLLLAYVEDPAPT